MDLSPDAVAMTMPKHNSHVSKLRWEIANKCTKECRRPLSDADVERRQAQVDAFEGQRIAAGGKRFRALNKKLDGLPMDTAIAVVSHLTSVDVTPGLDIAAQIDVDNLKIQVLKTRVNTNQRALASSSSSSVVQNAVLGDGDGEEFKRMWSHRARAIHEQNDRVMKQMDKDEKKRKREFENEHRYDHQCLGCQKFFAWEKEYFSHMKECKKYYNLPLDKFGFRRGEEPDSPTLRKVWQLSKANGDDFWV